MMEDIHHIYCLPIQDQQIQHVINQDSISLNIAIVYGVGSIDKVMSEMFSSDLPYLRYWRNKQQGLLRASYLMGLIQCYALPYANNGRFPQLLLLIVASMLQQGMVYDWAPTLLSQIYQELFFYSLGHRASLSIIITLQAWAYKHIHVAHPLGLLILGFASHAAYPINIMSWREDFYTHPLDGIHWDISFYQRMIVHLIIDQVRF